MPQYVVRLWCSAMFFTLLKYFKYLWRHRAVLPADSTAFLSYMQQPKFYFHPSMLACCLLSHRKHTNCNKYEYTMKYESGTAVRIASRQPADAAAYAAEGGCSERHQQVNAACALTRWQHFSARRDVMAVILIVWRQIQNLTPSIDDYYFKNNCIRFHRDPIEMTEPY